MSEWVANKDSKEFMGTGELISSMTGAKEPMIIRN